MCRQFSLASAPAQYVLVVRLCRIFSMHDWGCNGGSADKHVFVILEGSSASSSSREPDAFVLDVEGGLSLTANYGKLHPL